MSMQRIRSLMREARQLGDVNAEIDRLERKRTRSTAEDTLLTALKAEAEAFIAQRQRTRRRRASRARRQARDRSGRFIP